MRSGFLSRGASESLTPILRPSTLERSSALIAASACSLASKVTKPKPFFASKNSTHAELAAICRATLEEVRLQDVRKASIRQVVVNVATKAALLKEGVQSRGVLVLGAEYSLDTGCVDFFEGLHD